MKDNQETKKVRSTAVANAHPRDSYRLTELETGTAMLRTERKLSLYFYSITHRL